MERELTLAAGPGPLEGRLGETLRAALKGRAVRLYQDGETLENRRLLFAFSLPESGVSAGLHGLLARLRERPGCLTGSVGGVVIDGPWGCAMSWARGWRRTWAGRWSCTPRPPGGI